MSETKEFWNRVASDWDIQVGDNGDGNRRLNSDPVLWRFAGEVKELNVLDAGCGTGYLSRQLSRRGAHVIGVDFSDQMINIARTKDPAGDYRIDSCAELSSIADGSIDLIIANYVLMDTPDLERTLTAFSRVLRIAGAAVVVFSHPCFPQGRATATSGGEIVSYRWPTSYFDRRKCVDPPWAHFKSEFIWFHRPLSDYWKAFCAAGFGIVEFEEPRIRPENFHMAANIRSLRNCQTRPYSVAFRLRKERTASDGNQDPNSHDHPGSRQQAENH